MKPHDSIQFSHHIARNLWRTGVCALAIIAGVLCTAQGTTAQIATSTALTATTTIEELAVTAPPIPQELFHAQFELAQNSLTAGAHVTTTPGVEIELPRTTSTPLTLDLLQLFPEELPPVAWSATTTTTTVWQIDVTSPVIKPWIPSAPIKITLPVTGPYYKKKIISFWDNRLSQWRNLASTTDFERNAVSALYPLPYGRFIVRESETIYEGIASWYKWKNCNCAAFRFMPKKSILKVTNISPSARKGKSVTVRVNDYGPEEWTERLIDLDYVAYRAIGLPRGGIMPVRVELIDKSK
ncbi:MAG: septal ring lytic transglycosylase RlpA family protein [Patescibacteria group bacterium]